jgi:N-acetylglutamate synthase-like GNAT family acetyltransferase
MSEHQLRSAESKDQAVIRKLALAGKINPTGLDWRRFQVAESAAGEVIGCVQRKLHRDGSVELATLVVQEAWRGRGVARALIEAVLADHEGELYLMCRGGLGAFYQKFGFEILSEEEMPIYFRRVSRLMGIITDLRLNSEGLLIMRRDCG